MAFKLEVKLVTVEGSSFGVVENGLVRDVDIKDSTKDICCFSGGDGE